MAARSKKVKKKQYVNKNNFSIDGVQTNKQQNTSLSIDKTIKPITATQERAFDMWTQNSNIMLHGVAGTGKTFLALYFALRDVFDLNKSYHKVYIVRSVVPTRDMVTFQAHNPKKNRCMKRHTFRCVMIYSAVMTHTLF